MTEGDDWRARKKAATKHAIQEHALRLFVEKGYDATTVEEIAAAAGVSHMTFFRYFPRKEEVVEYDEYDPLLGDLVAARPADEPPLTALHRAIRVGLEQILTTDREALLIRTRLILRNPVLRSRNLLAQDTSRDLLARALGKDRQCVIDDPLGGRLLAVEHDAVDDLLDQLGAVQGIRLDRPDGGCGTARHR